MPINFPEVGEPSAAVLVSTYYRAEIATVPMGDEIVAEVLAETEAECLARAKDLVRALNSHDALVAAAEHAAKSFHHPSCKARGEYSGRPDLYCSCHVQKALMALAATGRTVA